MINIRNYLMHTLTYSLFCRMESWGENSRLPDNLKLKNMINGFRMFILPQITVVTFT